MEHVLERWRAPLQGVGDDRLDPPSIPRWQTRYSIDAMLEHAVMHPIGTRFNWKSSWESDDSTHTAKALLLHPRWVRVTPSN